jgi:hypothetical protein
VCFFVERVSIAATSKNGKRKMPVAGCRIFCVAILEKGVVIFE